MICSHFWGVPELTTKTISLNQRQCTWQNFNRLHLAQINHLLPSILSCGAYKIINIDQRLSSSISNKTTLFYFMAKQGFSNTFTFRKYSCTYLGLWVAIIALSFLSYIYLMGIIKIGITIFAMLSFALSAYDPDLGEKLCKLTVASYCNKNKVADWSCKPCEASPIKLDHVRQFHNSTGDNLGYIGTSGNNIHLVFRGTLPWDIKNWIQDFNFIKTKFPICDNGCLVHRGFYYAYQEIQQDVRNAVVEYTSTFGISTIIVTGHSLGGAIAVHAALDLVSINLKVDTLYTYGAPRVGDKKFTEWFVQFSKIKNVYRITHARDPVPHLPPQDFGFLHNPGEIFYKGSNKQGYQICKDTGSKQDKNCSNQHQINVDVLDHLTYYDIDFTGIVLACQI